MDQSSRRVLGLSIIGLVVSISLPSLAEVRPQLPTRMSAGEDVSFGKFRIRYLPIMCMRAPCPPGRYSITRDNKPIGTFRTVILVRSVQGSSQSTTYEGRYLDDIAGVEGQLHVVGTTARFLVLRTVEGPWKP